MPVQTEDGGADRLLDVLTHPPNGQKTKNKWIPHKSENKFFVYIRDRLVWLTLTSHFLARSNRWRWGESRCPLQTCSLVATTWRSEQRGWSWGWPEWASMRPPSGSTHRHYGLPRRWRCGYCQEPSQHLLRCKDRRRCLVCWRSYQLINYSYLRDKKSEKASRVKILLLQKLSCLHFCVMLSYASVATAQFN